MIPDRHAAGLENSALFPQATEEVAVADGVKAVARKRQHRGVGDHGPTGPRDAVSAGPCGGDPKASEREVHEHNVAAARLGQIEPWPAGARANIQETKAGSQSQESGDLLCLGPGRPAVTPIVATANNTLD
jgi:hypothetical protein